MRRFVCLSDGMSGVAARASERKNGGLFKIAKGKMMTNTERNHTMKRMLMALMTALTLGIIGCGKSDDAQKASSARETPAPSPAPAPVPAPDVPAEVPADAPTLAEVYPILSSGALRRARLTRLPDGVLLQAEGVSLSKRDLEEELAQAPDHMREAMRKNAFVILEGQATRALLVAQARQQTPNPALDENRLLREYFDRLTANVAVTDEEAAAFYEANRAMLGEVGLAEVKPQIERHLLQGKQQAMIEVHIRELGKDRVIALSAPWVAEQAPLVLDNALDKARSGGKPTFASFGADTCGPCQMMKPAREAIEAQYGDRVNVVYVHVNQEPMLSSRYGVRGIPHLMFFDAAGTLVHESTGVMSEEEITEWLKKIGVTL